MARIAPPAEVLDILGSGDFARLVGVIEDEHVEFKEQSYHLDNDERKMQLAKDVSALANVHEGVIVLGPRTGRPDASRPRDEVVHVSTFAVGLVNIEQYHQTLAALVFPTLENIDIRWYPSQANPAAGVVGILVPAQRASNRPFLTTKTLNENNRLSERSFGLFERRRANASPVSVYEVHGWLRAGRAASSTDALLDLVSRLEAIVAALEERGHEPAAAPIELPMPANPEQRLDESLALVELHDRPSIVLVAIPRPPINFPDFTEGNGHVAAALTHSPQLRDMGFDLNTAADQRLVEGVVRRAWTLQYKLLEVWRDGVIHFIATGDRDFLAWGRRDQQGQGFRINPLVVAEVTLLFTRFARQVYEGAEQRPERVLYRLYLRNVRDENGVRSRIVPYPLGTARWMAQEARTAPQENHTVEVELDFAAAPSVAAYRILREFYAWFGVDAENIPYAAGVGVGREISGDLIVAARD
jgi:hypothetical protein